VTPSDAVGVVLCGGASRRMGTDKATLELDGVAMARRTAGALREFGVGTVMTVGGDAPALAGFGDRHVDDQHPGQGPLGGVATAVGAARGSTLVVVACDLPDLDPELLSALWAAGAALDDGRVVVPVAEGREQWAVAMVPGAVAALVVDRFAAGARSLREGYGEVVRVDLGDGRSLLDLDTPEDVVRWRSRSGPRE
jgi:molybdopterin-guanine dinucleotide biosynthesis protein A